MALPLSYNWNNLFVRRTSTALTVLVVGIVVAVLVGLLSFGAGVRSSLVAKGDTRNLIVLRPGASAESTSIIRLEEAARVIQTPGAARRADGQLLVSNEICVQTPLKRKGGEKMANVAVRGVDAIAFDVHTEVRITQGSRFESGTYDVLVGKAAAERYEGLDIGDELVLGRGGNRRYRVIGIFESGGSALESELWAPRTSIADSYQRPILSSVAVRLEDGALPQAAIDYVNGPAVQLLAKRESDYYRDLSTQTEQLVQLTMMLVAVMSVGAVFAVSNTMYAAVDRRRREIAMLRTIGFSRAAIVTAFLLESVLLCLIASVAGLVAMLPLHGRRQDFLSDSTWTVFAYEMRLTPMVVAWAIGAAIVVGICGALAPAVRASRIQIIEALRKA